MSSKHKGNIQNIEKYKFTPETARKVAKKGNEASTKAKRARKTLREELLYLLDTTRKVKSGGKMSEKTMRELASIGLIERAIKGDATAYKVLRETIGEDAAPTKVAIEGGLSIAVPNLDGLTPEQIAELITK